MDIKKVSQKNNTIQLLIKGVDAAFLNAIRRTIMNSVPTLAVEKVTIYENSSVLFDEFLAHRLGLVPIKTDLQRYKKEGDKVNLILEKEGPCTVYSSDIKSTDPKADVALNKIPLLKLEKNQKIKLEMEAILGIGKTHPKFQPAVVGYKQTATLKVDPKFKPTQEIVEDSYGLEIKANKLVIADQFNWNLSGKFRDLAEIVYSDNSFLMEVETHGNLETKEVLLKAVDVLQEKVKDLKEQLKTLK